ncbi:hypothetical protein NQ318_006205 [Aromia moschata]|uniref:BZIP domain-containing protein n=1 Tax=Aromia moschata TaxID=1265417 RepID=A0AAV8YET9_9CUCU|nr:hypothetical protein NQ318_006205 [Aromia moschata]
MSEEPFSKTCVTVLEFLSSSKMVRHGKAQPASPFVPILAPSYTLSLRPDICQNQDPPVLDLSVRKEQGSPSYPLSDYACPKCPESHPTISPRPECERSTSPKNPILQQTDVNSNSASTRIKPSRPFKIYSKQRLSVNLIGEICDVVSKESEEAYVEFRDRVLARVQDDKGSTNVNMRRMQSQNANKIADPDYWEKRKKNNEAAKRSRDARRAKEDEIAIRCAFLEQENMQLKYRVATLENEMERSDMGKHNTRQLSYQYLAPSYNLPLRPDICQNQDPTLLDLPVRKEQGSPSYPLESHPTISPIPEFERSTSPKNLILQQTDVNSNSASTRIKPSRPFKIYSKQRLSVNLIGEICDVAQNELFAPLCVVSKESEEAYVEFRDRVLARVQDDKGSTNVNMRRTQSQNANKIAKNNEEAKRSRDAPTAKENEIAIRCAFLERENIQLNGSDKISDN